MSKIEKTNLEYEEKYTDMIDRLTEQLKTILPIFLEEFKDYIDPRRLEYLSDKKNVPNIIQFVDDGMGAWHYEGHIYFSKINNRICEKLKSQDEYGTQPNIKLIEPEDFINNKKDYIDYLRYWILKGLTVLDYCIDILPHEIMHLIGSSGGVIGEGSTEANTRRICQKYNIRCIPISHTKEVELVLSLENVFGIDVLTRSAFSRDFTILEREFNSLYGNQAFSREYGIVTQMYTRYQTSHLDDPIKHYQTYRKINYGSMLELLRGRREAKTQEVK